MMQLQIVLPSYNRKSHLCNILLQLSSQAEKINDISIGIIAVIDGSTDGSIEMVKNQFPAVHIVIGSGKWYYTKSMNEGFRYAQRFNPDFILALNDDVTLADDYLQKMIDSSRVLDRNSIIGCMALTRTNPPRILFSGEKKYLAWRQKHIFYHKKFEQLNNDNLNGLHFSAILPGRGLLIPNFILKELNYFDEFYVQYHSDTDFCLRAGKAGYKIFISWDARLYSFIEETSGTTSYIKSSFRKFLSDFKNPYSRIYIPHKAKLYYSHGPLLLWPVTMCLFFISTFKSFLFNKKLVDKSDEKSYTI